MKTKSKVVLSSLASIALCSSIVVGGTYALFTSESKVNIAVTAGKVNVTANIVEGSLKTSSTLSEFTGTNAFENGGTATFDTIGGVQTLNLANITPGDQAEFQIVATNESNVNIKYRFTWAVDGELSKVLEATVDGEALVNNATEWTKWENNAAELSQVFNVVVLLPENVDNTYQEKEASISFMVEAVQGNTVTKSAATTEAGLIEALSDPFITNITLNETFNVTDQLTVPANKTLALDMNSQTVNNSVTNRGTVTISDGKINVNDFGFENYGNATITNVTMNAGSATDYSNISAAGSETEYNNVIVNSAGGGIGAVGGAKVTFNSGSVEVNSTSTSGRYLFYAEGEGTEITINGGNFDFNKTQNQKRAYIYAGVGTTVYVTGGTFGTASTRAGYTAGILGEGKVIITGGTFGFNPSAWVAEGYQAVESNGVWVVTQK